MYKVFVNDKLIILSDESHKDSNLPVFLSNNLNVTELVSDLYQGNLKGAFISCTNLESDWNYFKSQLKIQKAGGGLVQNTNDEILMIYRNKKWDLPKGKIEKGETIEVCALREVEEECGITNLVIIDKLPITYHIFYTTSGFILKQTHWFFMQTTFTNQLVPQIEEGITKAEFVSNDELPFKRFETYENINLVIDAYLKKFK